MKTLKKLLTVTLIALATLITFTSCESDDSNDITNTNTNEQRCIEYGEIVTVNQGDLNYIRKGGVVKRAVGDSYDVIVSIPNTSTLGTKGIIIVNNLTNIIKSEFQLEYNKVMFRTISVSPGEHITVYMYELHRPENLIPMSIYLSTGDLSSIHNIDNGDSYCYWY